MQEMDNEAEKEDGVKKKGRVGLKVENELKVGEDLEEGAKTKMVEKNKVKCAHKGDLAKCGFEVETGGVNMKTVGGLLPEFKQLSNRTSPVI